MPEVAADVTITFVKFAGGATGEVKYRGNLFHRVSIHRFARHFMTVLGAAFDNIDATIGDLQNLSAPERHGLLIEWNDTGVEYSGDRRIHKIFEAP
jgi:non-ribosomal peptide synthetase component F